GSQSCSFAHAIQHPPGGPDCVVACDTTSHFRSELPGSTQPILKWTRKFYSSVAMDRPDRVQLGFLLNSSSRQPSKHYSVAACQESPFQAQLDCGTAVCA